MGILRSLDGRFYDVPEDVLERCVLPEKLVRRLRGVDPTLEGEEGMAGGPQPILETECLEDEEDLCPVGAEEGAGEATAQDRRRRIASSWHNWHNWSNWHNWHNWSNWYNWYNG